MFFEGSSVQMTITFAGIWKLVRKWRCKLMYTKKMQIYIQKVLPLQYRSWFNDAVGEKLCFTQLRTRSYWNWSLATSDLFHVFTQLINLYTFHCHILKSADIWKRWFINRQKINCCSFHQTLRQNLKWFLP